MLFLMTVLLSALIVWGMIKINPRGLHDEPNSRSAHKIAVPRGGGLGIFLSFYLVLFFSHQENLSSLFLWLPAIGIVFISFLDDLYNVPAKRRLMIHGIVALLFVYFFVEDSSHLLFGFLSESYLGRALLVLYLIWGLNLYNFMDGINGLAVWQAITTLAGILLISWIHFGFYSATLVLLLGACVGFAFFNFPKAYIFMGDIGSAFIGFALFSSSLVTNIPMSSWLILLGVFIVDATICLISRFIETREFMTAHNLHAYQKAARKYKSHTKVTFSVMGINLLWLLPIAILNSFYIQYEIGFIVIAYLPLAYLCLVTFRSGKTEAKSYIQAQ